MVPGSEKSPWPHRGKQSVSFSVVINENLAVSRLSLGKAKKGAVLRKDEKDTMYPS